jgi:hypothetical protein
VVRLKIAINGAKLIVTKQKKAQFMTTEEIIIHNFYHVDNALLGVQKEPKAKLYPSEVVTIGILFALKGGHFRAFYRCLKRDYNALFGGLPDRTNLQRQLRQQESHTDHLLAQPSVLNVADSFPIELIFPVREGRRKGQFGKKGKDKGRWSVGVKLCWVLNTYGQVCAWIWGTLNCPDNEFLEYFGEYDGEAIFMADWGFRCADGVPENVKLCKKGTWNERMAIETSFSLLTVICKAKKFHHRLEPYIQARLAYTAAMFNVCLALFHQLHPEQSQFKMSIAEFSL